MDLADFGVKADGVWQIFAGERHVVLLEDNSDPCGEFRSGQRNPSKQPTGGLLDPSLHEQPRPKSNHVLSGIGFYSQVKVSKAGKSPPKYTSPTSIVCVFHFGSTVGATPTIKHRPRYDHNGHRRTYPSE